MSSDNWQPTNSRAAHDAALIGRPVLLYGTPRYGPTAKREAIGYFVTGRGWLEVGQASDLGKFEPTHFMLLPDPPSSESTQ